MMFYKNTKAMVHPTNGNTDFFYIFAGILQWDSQALFLFIVCLVYILQTSIKENRFTLKKRQKADDIL